MPSKPPRPPRRESFSAVRARVGELEQEVVRRRGEAAAMAAAARLAQREPDGRGPGRSRGRDHHGALRRRVRLHPASRPGRRARGAGMGRDGRAPRPSSAGTSCRPGWPQPVQAVALGRAVWTPDVLTDPAIVLSPDLRRLTEATKDRAVLAVPLKARGAAIGAVIIAYPVGRVLRGGRGAAGRGLLGPDCAGVRQRPAVPRQPAPCRGAVRPAPALARGHRAPLDQAGADRDHPPARWRGSWTCGTWSSCCHERGRRDTLEVALRISDGRGLTPGEPRRYPAHARGGLGMSVVSRQRAAAPHHRLRGGECARRGLPRRCRPPARPPPLGGRAPERARSRAGRDDPAHRRACVQRGGGAAAGQRRPPHRAGPGQRAALRGAHAGVRRAGRRAGAAVRTAKLRALGEMAAGVAHDFNNLLAAIARPGPAAAAPGAGSAAPPGPQGHRGRRAGWRPDRPPDPGLRADAGDEPACRWISPPWCSEVVEIARPRWKDEAHAAASPSRWASSWCRCRRGRGRGGAARGVLNVLLNAVDAMPRGRVA